MPNSVFVVWQDCSQESVLPTFVLARRRARKLWDAARAGGNHHRIAVSVDEWVPGTQERTTVYAIDHRGIERKGASHEASSVTTRNGLSRRTDDHNGPAQGDQGGVVEGADRLLLEHAV